MKLGYCALDKSRAPISGSEQRSCWERSGRETFEQFESPFEPETGESSIWASYVPEAVVPEPDAARWGMNAQPLGGGALSIHDAGLRVDAEPERQRPGPANLQHDRSVRERPWGRPPARIDPALRRVSLRDRATRRGLRG